MAKGLMDFVKDAKARIREITPEQLAEMLRHTPDLLLVDVREPGEFIHGHIRPALLIPRGVLEPAADPAYANSNETLREARLRPLVIYCASGGRSAMAADVLQQMGFADVYSLAGGIAAWQQSGQPVFKEGEY